MLEMEALLSIYYNIAQCCLNSPATPRTRNATSCCCESRWGLNNTLAGRDYLAGGQFSVADLNVAGILVWGKMERLNLSPHPNVARWLDSCLARVRTSECGSGQGTSRGIRSSFTI